MNDSNKFLSRHLRTFQLNSSSSHDPCFVNASRANQCDVSATLALLGRRKFPAKTKSGPRTNHLPSGDTDVSRFTVVRPKSNKNGVRSRRSCNEDDEDEDDDEEDYDDDEDDASSSILSQMVVSSWEASERMADGYCHRSCSDSRMRSLRSVCIVP